MTRQSSILSQDSIPGKAARRAAGSREIPADGTSAHSELGFSGNDVRLQEKTMQFSIYSEIQSWPGKTHQQN